jgi:hypothetical protein
MVLNNRPVKRLGLRGVLAAAVVLLLAMAAGFGVYQMHRNASYSSEFGALDEPDRVNVAVWISRVDTATQTLAAEIVSVEPAGKLADPDGGFAHDTVLTTSAIGDPITIKKGQTPPDTPRTFAVNGTVTDYPFDRYHSSMTFSATTADGTALPVAVKIWSDDPFFRNTATHPAEQSGERIDIDLSSVRAMPTVVFAVFVMVLMLGLAVAAVTASYYLLRWRRGLIFPACSMMAAILFALIPLRNAVPGNPPIGSLIDFVSFFIAEAVIAVALIASVVVGYRMEMANELAANQLATEPDAAA